MDINDYFVSDDFMNALIPLYGRVDDENILTVVEFIISSTVKFSSYNNFSMDGVEGFVRKLIQKINSCPIDKSSFSTSSLSNFVEDLSFESVLKRIGVSIEDLKNIDVQDRVVRYIINNIRLNKYMYHAFNTSALNSILEHGLNPNIRLTDQSEIDKIDAIFLKHGINMIFGWQKINCEGRLSFSESPSVSYSYAVRSPEWFSQFCGGTHAFMGIKNRVFRTFQMGNYEGSKNNLFSLMKLHNFSVDEMQMVFDFFDVNWKRYANHESMLAVVPDQAKCDFEFLYKRYNELGYNVRDIFGFCTYDGDIDFNIQEVIDVSDARLIKLPNYKNMYNKLSNSNMMGKLEILRNSKIYFETDKEGNRVLRSVNGEEEVKLVKGILADNDVYNYILDSNDYIYLGWIPYFNNDIINNDDNVVKLFQKANHYFSYVSESKRNDVNLMKRCISGEEVSKAIMFMVGPQVLDDLEFVSLLIIKMKDCEFDFGSPSMDSIDGSRMGYGKLIGRNVQTNSKFWNLVNSKIKLINKKYRLNTPLFNESKEIVIASRYFDGAKGKN